MFIPIIHNPAFVKYNGIKYRYIHNLQGDIVAIVDAAGNTVVEYKYDVWGKPISISGNMASSLGDVNPFRYRGYVWDDEPELYYLRSRYYCTCFNRFINTDSILATYLDLNSLNLFAFCKCSPVIFADEDGYQSYILVAA